MLAYRSVLFHSKGVQQVKPDLCGAAGAGPAGVRQIPFASVSAVGCLRDFRFMLESKIPETTEEHDPVLEEDATIRQLLSQLLDGATAGPEGCGSRDEDVGGDSPPTSSSRGPHLRRAERCQHKLTWCPGGINMFS